jgi:hypothetical protein
LERPRTAPQLSELTLPSCSRAAGSYTWGCCGYVAMGTRTQITLIWAMRRAAGCIAVLREGVSRFVWGGSHRMALAACPTFILPCRRVAAPPASLPLSLCIHSCLRECLLVFDAALRPRPAVCPLWVVVSSLCSGSSVFLRVVCVLSSLVLGFGSVISSRLCVLAHALSCLMHASCPFFTR